MTQAIEVIGAAPLTRRTLWTVRMANCTQQLEVWVVFGMEFDESVPGLIRLFPTRVSVQVEDQAPPTAYLNTNQVPAVKTEEWVQRAFAFARKKVQARQDYFKLWCPAPKRLRVVLEGPAITGEVHC